MKYIFEGNLVYLAHESQIPNVGDYFTTYIGRTPVVRLNRAVALSRVAGPEPALAEVDRLEASLAGAHLWHAVRGSLLRDLGRTEEALAADLRALELTANDAERRLLAARVSRG